uniref:Uncharacterized protein n=1 Tax=Moniliophthora roreri TaxID=221103 RepID=A0A0W0FZI9_MONRR
MPLCIVPSFSVYYHLLCGHVICLHSHSKMHLSSNQSSIFI